LVFAAVLTAAADQQLVKGGAGRLAIDNTTFSVPITVRAGDVNGDGFADLVAGGGSRVTGYLGKDLIASASPPATLSFRRAATAGRRSTARHLNSAGAGRPSPNGKVFYSCRNRTRRPRGASPVMAQVLDAPPRSSAAGFSPSLTPTLTLFLISVVGLFLELMLIRWVTTEIRIFAYLQNTVLVACFLGLGMGCWDCRKPFALRHVLLPLLVLVGLLAVPTTRLFLGHTITAMLGRVGGMEYWGAGGASGLAAVSFAVVGVALTAGLMFLLWATFVPVGRLLGKLLNDHPNTLRAYSVNVAGSLIGIWLFVACSAVGLPPVAWFAAFAAGVVPLLGADGRSKLGELGMLAALLGFAWLGGVEPGWQETRWSPYQKLAVMAMDEPAPTVWGRLGGERAPPTREVGTHFIAVNNIGYQATIDLDPARVAARPDKFPPAQRGYSQYDLPAKLHPAPKSMLIVGAGSGNDVAGALRNGAESVTAVEIDPAIIDFGRKYHPEKPYADPRVRVVNDDARSFFATTTEKYDVIAFGLLDSHTTTAMTNARLDHYVYTRESLAHAKTLLNPGGVVVLSFEAQKPYIADRMARALGEVFGREPLVFRAPFNSYGWGGVVFVSGDRDAAQKQIDAQPRLAALVEQWKANMPFELTGATAPATDDWPYIYLESPSIPPLYLLLAVALLALFAVGLRVLDAPQIVRGWDRGQSHFFFLGAAFMLLEVQNISKASVVLGNTWVVNAVIISGVLGMVLAANLVTARLPNLPAGPVYGLLVASCLGLYFLDLSTFAFLPYPTKALTVGALTSLPMLFSGIVFARSFVAAPRKDRALGANLFGSLVGALLQTLTFVVGIKALLLVVAALYIAALLTRPKDAAVAESRPEAEPAVA
jgi:spermidine synthase